MFRQLGINSWWYCWWVSSILLYYLPFYVVFPRTRVLLHQFHLLIMCTVFLFLFPSISPSIISFSIVSFVLIMCPNISVSVSSFSPPMVSLNVFPLWWNFCSFCCPWYSYDFSPAPQFRGIYYPSVLFCNGPTLTFI